MFKKNIIKIANYINIFIFCYVYIYHIMVYVLFSDIGFVQLTNEKFSNLLLINFILILVTAFRIVICLGFKKKNNKYLIIICFVFLFCLTGGFLFTLYGILSGFLKGVLLKQYLFIFIFPYLYIFLLIISEIYNFINSKKVKNIMKYW